VKTGSLGISSEGENMRDIQLVAPNDKNIVAYVNADGELSPLTCKFEEAGGQNNFFYESPEDRWEHDRDSMDSIVLVDTDGNRWSRMDVELYTVPSDYI
jgi:hypothetical protein